MRVLNGIEILTTMEELVDPKHTAIIVIDVMNIVMKQICSNEGAENPRDGANLENVGATVEPTQRLLDAARKKGVLVTYAEFVQCNKQGVSLMSGPNIYCHKDAESVIELKEGSWEMQTIDELAPQEGDVVIYKNRGSAFYHTELDDILRIRGIKTLIHTGVLSSGCVLFNSCDAMNHSYYPVIPRECVGTYDLEDHNRVMAWMETKFPVCNLDEILTIWK